MHLTINGIFHAAAINVDGVGLRSQENDIDMDEGQFFDLHNSRQNKVKIAKAMVCKIAINSTTNSTATCYYYLCTTVYGFY